MRASSACRSMTAGWAQPGRSKQIDRTDGRFADFAWSSWRYWPGGGAVCGLDGVGSLGISSTARGVGESSFGTNEKPFCN